MATEPAAAGEKPAPNTPATSGVDDDPAVRKAKRDLELAKIALEEKRLSLTDQSERAKLVKEMVPDLGTATVEKDTTAASEKSSSVAENFLQRAVANAVDDLVDLAVTAVNARPEPTRDGQGASWTFLVTSDGTFLDDGAARRDVLLRLSRIHAALNEACDSNPKGLHGREERLHLRNIIAPPTVGPLLTAGLSALPGAISLATRLLAHQYTTSSYTSTGTGGVDARAAGGLAARTRSSQGTRVLLARLLPAIDATLQGMIVEFSHDLDGKLDHALRDARVDAARASHQVDRLAARRGTLEQRAIDIQTAWKDKVGKSAAAAGLAEDLALTKALETAIADAEDEAEKGRLTAVLSAVKARINAVLKEVADGSGEMGTEELLTMLTAIDDEARHIAAEEAEAKSDQARADELVARFAAIHTSGLELLESLAATDPRGDRLIDKACRGAVLDDPATVVLFTRLLHAGADNVDETKVGPDYRTAIFGATVEWALFDHVGVVLDAGVRTALGSARTKLSDPADTEYNLIGYASIKQVDLRQDHTSDD